MKDALPESPDDLHEEVTALRTAMLCLLNDSFESNIKVDKLSEQVKDLHILQKQTDERLNAVILMAEKFFRGEKGDSKK